MRLRLFLCGDVMTGRGVDQIMAHPCAPELHEGYVRSALDYVGLAEAVNGPIPRSVEPSYVWGDALEALADARPHLRIVNLETSITHSDDAVAKGINYRMSPENADCLAAAGIDCCVLANNHVLDWGRAGLHDTLAVLERLGIKTCGAGIDVRQAETPAVFDVAETTRVLVFSYASVTSGVPWDWAAAAHTAGVSLLPDLADADAVCRQIAEARRPDDVVIVSIHWGGNWGHDIPKEQRRFAHALVDNADVSVVHGHSSHHAKAIEVYRDRLILYGCGDFLNDYEGIRGYEHYRDDLAVMYLADIDASNRNLAAVELVPFQIKRFRLVRASRQDAQWLTRTLDRECRKLGTGVVPATDGRLRLDWQG